MRLSTILVCLVASAVAKNTVKLDQLEQRMQKDFEKASLMAREPKNVIGVEALGEALDSLSKGENIKREVKVEDFVSFLRDSSSSNFEKLHAIVSKDTKEKRDPKNTISVDDLRSALQEEMNHTKRDARHVINLDELESSLKSYTKKDQIPFNKQSKEGSLDELNLLHTTMSTNRDISIFAGYVRDEERVISAFVEGEILVVIAPTNHALSTKLNGLKPWEFPLAITGGEQDEANVASNLSNFVLSNLISLSKAEWTKVFKSGTNVSTKVQTYNGKYVELAHIDGQDFVNEFAVQEVIEYENGLILVIDDSLVKP